MAAGGNAGAGDRRDAEAAAQAEDTYRLRVTDEVLSVLVGACDDGGFSMALTVQAGGFLVGGVLISHGDYFRGLATLVRGSAGGTADEGVDAFAAVFDSLAEGQEQRRARRTARLQNPNARLEPEDEVRPAYLHLREARLVGPGVRTTTPYWRGRLDHVDAFWFGSLSAEQE